MRVSIVPVGDLGVEEYDRWHEIQDADSRFDNAFLSPEFAAAVNRHRHRVDVAIIEDDNKIVGFLPFERRGRGVVAGLGTGLADAQAAILEQGFSVPWRAILLEAKAGLIDFDHLTGEQATDDLHSRVATSPIVDLSSGIAEFEKRKQEEHKSRFKAFDRKSKKIARDFESANYEFHTSDETTAFALLKKWKSAHYRRSGYHDIYNDRTYVELLEDLLTLRSVHCSGVLSTLTVDGRVIAAQISLKSRDTLSSWVPTYDVEMSQYSPGIELLRRTLRAHEAVGFTRYDFGKGDEDYKQQFKTGDLEVSTAWYARPTFAAYAHRARKAPLEKAERFILDHPALRLKVRETLQRVGKLRSSN